MRQILLSFIVVITTAIVVNGQTEASYYQQQYPNYYQQQQYSNYYQQPQYYQQQYSKYYQQQDPKYYQQQYSKYYQQQDPKYYQQQYSKYYQQQQYPKYYERQNYYQQYRPTTSQYYTRPQVTSYTQDGRYRPEIHSGRYFHDNSGQYVHDHRGQYDHSDKLAGHYDHRDRLTGIYDHTDRARGYYNTADRITGQYYPGYYDQSYYYNQGRSAAGTIIGKKGQTGVDVEAYAGQTGINVEYPGETGAVDRSYVVTTTAAPATTLATDHHEAVLENEGNYVLGGTAAQTGYGLGAYNLVSYNQPTTVSVGNEVGAAAGTSEVRVNGNLFGPDARERFSNNYWRILSYANEQYPDGYHYLYQTENGINAEEEGHLENKGTDQEGLRAQGYYSYTGPDNVVYTVRYVADKDGFNAEGDHLPTPPPIPPLIQRALDYQRSLGLI